MPMRVLHVINGEFYAGAERVQDLLACRLPEHGYACDFFALKRGSFEANRSATSSRVYATPMTSRLDVSVIRSLVSVLRQGNYCLLHTHTARGALIGRVAAAWTGTPMVHHVHSPTRRDTEHAFRNSLNAFVEERLAFPGARKLIAVSNSLRQYLLDIGVAADRVVVVPNGVPVATAPSYWRAPQGEWVIGTVALFRPRKGLEVMLAAIGELRRRGLPVRLKVVGGFETDEYRQAMQALAVRVGIGEHVEWTGFTRDVPREMARFSIFALPSLYGEGLPMVLIEAMAIGVPVVATKVEGVPEVIGDDRTGVLVQPGDARSLADGIESVIARGARAVELAETGRNRQREMFSDAAMARAVARIYDETLLAERPAAVWQTGSRSGR